MIALSWVALAGVTQVQVPPRILVKGTVGAAETVRTDPPCALDRVRIRKGRFSARVSSSSCPLYAARRDERFGWVRGPGIPGDAASIDLPDPPLEVGGPGVDFRLAGSYGPPPGAVVVGLRPEVADVEIGDVIVAVNGVSVSTLQTGEAVREALLGPVGTSVELRLAGSKGGRERLVELVRTPVPDAP
ncbi:MAG: hypothetical protein H6737_18380 [Alphaproteobacteria bacterium]|nr:hypothetical protein [Alphaproteobacteria bacterium]